MELAPLTDASEIAAIEKAASEDGSVLAPASSHFKEAVRLLSLKPTPDFRNSMKESISAVEGRTRRAPDCSPLASRNHVPRH